MLMDTMTATKPAKQTASARLASWLGRLYEVGSSLSRDLPRRVEEHEAAIAKCEAEIKARRANIRAIEKSAESQVRECGWTEDQIAAAKNGETLDNNGNKWRR